MLKRFIYIGYSLLLAVGSLVMANTINFPRKVDGNPTCADLGYTNGFKIDKWSDASFPTDGYEDDDYLTFKWITKKNGDNQHGFETEVTSGGEDDSIEVEVRSEDGVYVDWKSSIYIDAVIVKGGPNANVYEYDPAATSDEDLHSPINPNTNSPYDISHVTFCWGLPEATVTPTNTSTPTQTKTPSPTPTKTPTKTPTPTVTPDPEETPTPTVTPDPEETPTPTPEATDTPTPTATDTPVPEPTDTPAPDPTDTPAPDPTDTPAPVDTPSPTPVPVVRERILEGITTDEEILGIIDDRLPLLEGIRLAYERVLGEIVEQLPWTSDIVDQDEKLPSGNQITGEQLIIPSLDLNQPVYQGQKIGEQWLVGHNEVLKTYAHQDPVYYGHNSDLIFGNLYQLNIGDQIVVKNDGQMNFYQISEVARVSSTYVQTLENDQSGTITLLTCDHWNPNLRLIIKALKNE